MLSKQLVVLSLIILNDSDTCEIENVDIDGLEATSSTY